MWHGACVGSVAGVSRSSRLIAVLVVALALCVGVIVALVVGGGGGGSGSATTTSAPPVTSGVTPDGVYQSAAGFSLGVRVLPGSVRDDGGQHTETWPRGGFTFTVALGSKGAASGPALDQRLRDELAKAAASLGATAQAGQPVDRDGGRALDARLTSGDTTVVTRHLAYADGRYVVLACAGPAAYLAEDTIAKECPELTESFHLAR